MKTLILTAITLLVFSFSNAQQLNVFIKKALSNNPTIQHVELQHNIASEKINEKKENHSDILVRTNGMR